MFGKNKMKELQKEIDFLKEENGELKFTVKCLKEETQKNNDNKKWWGFAIARTKGTKSDNTGNKSDAVNLANVLNCLGNENLADEDIGWEFTDSVIWVKYRSENNLTAKLAKAVCM